MGDLVFRWRRNAGGDHDMRLADMQRPRLRKSTVYRDAIRMEARNGHQPIPIVCTQDARLMHKSRAKNERRASCCQWYTHLTAGVEMTEDADIETDAAVLCRRISAGVLHTDSIWYF